MDDECRWSRRGSLFSAHGLGSRRGSLANTLSNGNRRGSASDGVMDVDPAQGTILKENGVLMEDPASMIIDEEEDDDTVVVAFCGSVMEKYHTFRARCQAMLDDLVQQPWPQERRKNGMTKLTTKMDQRRVLLEENCDGGILGAGILAAVMDTKELSASIVGVGH